MRGTGYLIPEWPFGLKNTTDSADYLADRLRPAHSQI
jgi:hypothetical protein